eukprot:g80926.t1
MVSPPVVHIWRYCSIDLGSSPVAQEEPEEYLPLMSFHNRAQQCHHPSGHICTCFLLTFQIKIYSETATKKRAQAGFAKVVLQQRSQDWMVSILQARKLGRGVAKSCVTKKGVLWRVAVLPVSLPIIGASFDKVKKFGNFPCLPFINLQAQIVQKLHICKNKNNQAVYHYGSRFS